MRIIQLIVLTSVFCAILTGCSSRQWNDPPFLKRLTSKVRNDPPIAYEVTGPIAVDVQSFNGDVFITADPHAEVATVKIRRQAIHGRKRKKEAKASLPEIHYSVDLVSGPVGMVLQVRAETDHPEPHFQRAHVYITAPAVENVYVRTSNGKVKCIDVQGEIDIITDHDDVRVMSNWPIREAVSISNESGDIDYRVRGESTGLFDCESIGGTVSQRSPYGHWSRFTPDLDSLHAVLNNGSNPIKLRTIDGDIRIAVVHNPTRVGLKIW